MGVIYRGSVKDLLESPDPDRLVFYYSDAYSVFDWGRMPDPIIEKGTALAVLSAYFFERLEDPGMWREFSKTSSAFEIRKGISQIASASRPKGHTQLTATGSASLGAAFNEAGERLQETGLRTHYLGLIEIHKKPSELIAQDFEKVARLKDVKNSSRFLAVKKVNVIRPHIEKVLGRAVMDYHPVRTTPVPRLIPLEVVFRFGCPPGSSLLSRVEKNPEALAELVVPPEMIRDGIKAGDQWGFPIIELFTKLESTDRKVSLTEALAIAGISASQLDALLVQSIWVAGFLKAAFAKHGLELADGKLEWGLAVDGSCFLVDGIGPDELRVLRGETQLSKEFLRKFYRANGWQDEVKRAKSQALDQGMSDWKSLVKMPPPPLGQREKELSSQVYLALANEITGRRWFESAWSVDRVVEELRKV